MAFFERTTEEIVTNSLEKLSQRSNITRLSPGSKTRVLLDIVSEEQGSQHAVFDANLMQVFLKYADSRFLEFFGDMLNEPISESTYASSGDENFMFYVSSGTFGSINGGSDITITAGEIVSTTPIDGTIITPGIEQQPVIEYVTTETVTGLASASYVYAPVRARVEGSEANIPRNVLNKHSFTGYLLSSSNTLKCTNKYAISNGEERESPESYRFRLQNLFRAREMATPTSIRLAALSVPGVSNLKEVTCEQGPGSYSLYVLSTTPTTSPNLLEQVANVVQTVSSFGVRPFILAPEPLGLELVCSVNWNKNATRDDITRGYIQMRDALENRLNKIDIGEEVELSELRDIMLSSTQFAISIGDAVPNQFEEMYIYRRDPSTEGVIRNIFTGDKVSPLYNERVILETSGTHHGIRFITRQ